MGIRNTEAALPVGSVVMLDGIHKLICMAGFVGVRTAGKFMW